ncbi:c-type cytochrome biogenesis protein CcmI [Jannaschia pohangensis]|uniref:Cytochrome c-type biogenesis protein CcmH n=1 Tax=Jannaschia pohangensis TaxID=390807 RepID=A0A1I3H5K7_9RHOB|nr:c-type cytochrome biogenesis protein CcmI [Jannaschia pohangensis]SFI30953.1 cytochrome c-type biogenesis protein CcmH [Jannaschia pohangensis]
MLFWIVAGVIMAICVAAMAAGLRGDDTDAGDAPDIAVYRDQLDELDRDAARGTLAPEEAEAARVEVARRLLSADKTERATFSTGSRNLGLALIILPVIIVSVATYMRIGAHGFPDFPLQARIERIEEARAARPGQAEAEATVEDAVDTSDPDVTSMAEQLKTVLNNRPDDLRGWRLAVQTQAGLGDLEAAWRSQNRVIAILGDDAEARDFSILTELLVLAAGGYVSPEAEEAIDATLARDPRDGTARYYQGLMYAQGGRPDRAWVIWRQLVAESTPDAPWLPLIYAQIEEVSALAGDPTRVEDLPQPRGPSAADIDAAGEMTPEDRIAMIEGMVGNLSERLASEGGPPSDWARLITSLGVLGQGAAAAQVYAEAKVVFAGDQGSLDMLAQAADQAGIAP